ncbi:MAG: PaaI family thioesterase [Bacillota bacterium]
MSRPEERQVFTRLVGAERTMARDGRSEVRLAIRPHHKNELGIVHGGVLMALADEAIGLAAYSAVGAGTAVVTAELHVHFLLPVRDGLLVARGQVWRAGRRLVTGEAVIELVDAAGADAAAGPEGRAPADGWPAGRSAVIVARADGTWATVTPDVPLP